MKLFGRTALSVVMTVLCFFIFGVAVNAANPSYQVTGSVLVKVSGGYGEVEMYAADGNAYRPDSDRKAANMDGNRFYVTFNEPGNYCYRICQIPGNDPAMVYDTKVFDILFCVTTDSIGQLSVKTVITEANRENKVDEILFRNYRKFTSVNTGDEGNPGLYACMLAMSAGIIAFAVVILVQSKGK